MSIADKITQLSNIRAAIRTALQNKGIAAASSHNFADFAADIAAIATGATLQSKRVSALTSGPLTVGPDSGYDGLSQVIVNMILRQAKTVTPGTADQTVSPDSGYQGLSSVTVEGDADLVPGNIKNGVSIFGIQGSYEGVTPSLQSKSVSPSSSQQVVTPDSGYDGLSQVTVAGAPLQTRTVTPSAEGLTVQKSSSSYYGLFKVNVNGDENLVAENIKKDVSIFGVTGTYEGSGEATNGSLIEISCSSNIDQVTATVNGHTYTAILNTSTHKAYVTIPYTDTTAARTCVVKGFYNGTQLTSSQVSMTAGIGYYVTALETSQRLYYRGTWYGVSEPTWTKSRPQSSVTNSGNGLTFYCPNGNYLHTFTMSPNVDTRGYKQFRVRYMVNSGSISGSSSTSYAATSYIKIGTQFINFPTQGTSGGSSIVATSVEKNASEDATLVVAFTVPMEGMPASITISEIEFV